MNLRSAPKTFGQSHYSGFTLVEIMIAVVIIGLLAAMAVPAFNRVRQKSRINTFINDLHVIENAVNQYANEHGSPPPDVNGGVFPPELAEYLRTPDFSAPTPIGGEWDWDNHGTYTRISIVPVDATIAALVDSAIDDGNTSTGLVRYDGNIRYYLSPP